MPPAPAELNVDGMPSHLLLTTLRFAVPRDSIRLFPMGSPGGAMYVEECVEHAQ